MAEERDINLRAVAIFGVSLTVTIALVMLVTGWLTNYWRDQRLARQSPPLPVPHRIETAARTAVAGQRPHGLAALARTGGRRADQLRLGGSQQRCRAHPD